MKLASLKDGSRDGHLAVVSRDLTQAHFATGIATTLQQVLDDWNFLSPQLEDLYATLNSGKARHAFTFDQRHGMAPLPRAHQWAEAVSAADAAVVMAWHGSGHFLGATDDATLAIAETGAAAEGSAGFAVITGDVAAGATLDTAVDSVRLLLLAQIWRPRIGRPLTTFGPVAVTPDEAGTAWRGGHLRLALEGRHDGQPVDFSNADASRAVHYGQLIAHMAQTQPLCAGSIVGSAAAGVSARHGDTLRLEARGRDGLSVFGAIVQRVAPLLVAQQRNQPVRQAATEPARRAVPAERAEPAAPQTADD